MHPPQPDGGVGFVVAGSVAVNLVDPSPAEIAAVSAQLGLEPTEPQDDPDLVVHYHDVLRPEGPLRHIELGRFAWTDDRFWMLRGLGDRRVRVTLDPSSLDRPLHLDCERRGTGVPLLTQMLGTLAAARGVVAVHAAAFRLHGQHVLVTGWSEAGKSEALLATARLGARPIGDDTVYLDPATGLLRGLPVPVRLKAWYAGDLPAVRDGLAGLDRLRLAPTAASAALAGRSVRGPGSARGSRVMRKLRELADQAMTVSAPLETVAGEPLDQNGHRLDHVVFVVNSDQEAVTVRAGDADETAARVQASLQEERANLVAAYRQLRFAFPGAAWPQLDSVDRVETEALSAAFRQARVWQLEHPHPVSLDRLGASIDQLVRREP